MEKLTVKRMYEYFLSEIRKDYTGTVIPQVWNILMKDALQEWKVKLSREMDMGIYGNAEQSSLSVVTDGVIAPMIKLFASGTPGIFFLNNPMSNDGTSHVSLNVGSTTGVYCTMFRRRSVLAGYSYVENDPASTMICSIPCHEMTAFEEADIVANYYRRPSTLKCYYTMGSKWRFFVPEGVKTLFVKLSYIKTPMEFYYDVQSPGDATNPAAPYTLGGGSVNSDISEEAKREVINICVKNYLKGLNDQRYQSYLQEQLQRLKG